jgi:hypothetical protein
MLDSKAAPATASAHTGQSNSNGATYDTPHTQEAPPDTTSPEAEMSPEEIPF